MNISYNISLTELTYRKFLSLNFYFNVNLIQVKKKNKTKLHVIAVIRSDSHVCLSDPILSIILLIILKGNFSP